MGLAIDRDHFEPAEHAAFKRRLVASLPALRRLLDRPGFGVGAPSLGAEIELALIDGDGRPLPLNRAVLADSLDPQLQLELDRFNLEYNLTPVPARGRPFTAMQAELHDALSRVDVAAAAHGGAVVAIGILPSLREVDLAAHAMTDLPRYRALSRALRALRHAAFEVHIDGPEPLAVSMDDVTMEGAATSLQIHLRTDPARFAELYNAAQLATAPALAVCGNSPLFLGHRLWQETRIALFKQAVDPRVPHGEDWRRPARVCFGHGYVRRDAYELFAETVALFPPLIPIVSGEDPSVLSGDAQPTLEELRLHMGTVWRWNRPVYDPAGGGHLRIELRVLPAGPTPIDCVANAALLVGLSQGLAGDVERLLNAMPFALAERNFYRAAQHGLDAGLVWPFGTQAGGLRELPARELLSELLPLAARGLQSLGVDDAECAALLGVVEARLQSGLTGSRYQLAQLERLERDMPRPRALRELTLRYLRRARGGAPVATWQVEQA